MNAEPIGGGAHTTHKEKAKRREEKRREEKRSN